MKKIFIGLLCLFMFCSCDVITTSTPQQDAIKIGRKFQSAKTPREFDEACEYFERYKQAYEKEIYNGRRNIEDLKTLVSEVGVRM